MTAKTDNLHPARSLPHTKGQSWFLCRATGSLPSFEDWMNRTHKGFYYGCWPCWNWRVGGVLVTLWLRNRIVKIYHDEGRATEWHPADTEMCRDAIATLLANNRISVTEK